MDEKDIPRWLRRRPSRFSTITNFIKNRILPRRSRYSSGDFISVAKRASMQRRHPLEPTEIPLEEAVDRFIAETQDAVTVAAIPVTNLDRYRVAQAEYMLKFMPVYARPAFSDEVEKLQAGLITREHSLEIRGSLFVAVAKSDPLSVRYQQLAVSSVLVKDMISLSKER